MPEHRTDLVVSARTKGFQDAQRQATKLVQDSSEALKKQTRGFTDMEKSVKSVDREVGKLEGTLQSLVKKQLDLTSAMEGISDKASPAYKDLAKQLKGVNLEANTVERTISRLDRAFRRQEQTSKRMMARGAFTQGLIQGATPGGLFLQRGPGMIRQTAGMAVGRTARGIAGGLASAPATGFGGLAEAAGAIPGVGGLLSGQIQAVSGMAQQGLGLQRQRLGMVPFLAGGGGRAIADIRRARARGAAGVAGPSPIAPVEITEEMRTTAREGAVQNLMREMGTGGERQRRNLVEKSFELQPRLRTQEAALLEGEVDAIRGGRIAESQADYERRRRRGGARGAAKARAGLFAPIRGAGRELMGVNQQEAMQTAGAIMQAGGGGLEGLREQGLLRTGFAAQTAYGVGPEVTGAFLQAGRRGGLSGLAPGTPGGGGEALTSAIADAMKLGLEGSEVNTYLQTMAEGISQWRQTGIPFAKEAIADFGSELGRLGIGGVRGAAIAGGVAGAAQRLSRGGPQTAQELLMMQTMGGLDLGTGAAGFEQAQIRLEQLKGGDVGGPELTKLFGQLMAAGGGGAAGRLMARQSLGQMGINIGAEEMQLMGKQIQGESLSEKQEKRLRDIQEQRATASRGAPESPQEMQNLASNMLKEFGSGLKTAAGIQNEQMKIGEKMIPALNNLNKAQMAVSKGFTELAGEPLTKLTEGVVSLTDVIVGKKGKGLVDYLSDWVAP